MLLNWADFFKISEGGGVKNGQTLFSSEKNKKSGPFVYH